MINQKDPRDPQLEKYNTKEIKPRKYSSTWELIQYRIVRIDINT